MLKWLHENIPILGKVFVMRTDVTAVTTQSNKAVSNEVKDNQALPEPRYRKN